MKRSIFFVINTMGAGGAERALISLLNAIPEEDYDIDLMVITQQGELVAEIPQYVHLISKCREVSVLSEDGRKLLKKLCRESFFKGLRGFALIPYMIGNYLDMVARGHIQYDKLLWRLLSDSAVRSSKVYDLAVSYIEGGATYYVADHVSAGHKVAFVHIPYSIAGYTRRLDRGCYNAFDRIFAVSEQTANDFKKFYPEVADKTGVFENLIDKARIHRLSVMGGFNDGYKGRRIVSVLRLTEQKAIDVSIEAMAIIKSVGTEARWYVYGEGDQRAYLEELIRQKGLESDFILCGTVPNPYPFIKGCDVYVHASRFEGRSIALREAKALGAAIIASDVPGNRGCIEDGKDGLLCEMDPKDIAAKVMRLLDDPKLAIALGEEAEAEEVEQADPIELLFDDHGR